MTRQMPEKEMGGSRAAAATRAPTTEHRERRPSAGGVADKPRLPAAPSGPVLGGFFPTPPHDRRKGVLEAATRHNLRRDRDAERLSGRLPRATRTKCDEARWGEAPMRSTGMVANELEVRSGVELTRDAELGMPFPPDSDECISLDAASLPTPTVGLPSTCGVHGHGEVDPGRVRPKLSRHALGHCRPTPGQTWPNSD